MQFLAAMRFTRKMVRTHPVPGDHTGTEVNDDERQGSMDIGGAE